MRKADRGPKDLAPRRPALTRPQKWVVGLSLLVLAVGLTNLARAGVALRYAALLPDLPMTVPLWYLAAMGGFWGVALIACGVGLIRFSPWSRWATLAAATLYEIHVWVNHLLFDVSDYARRTRPWDVLLTVVLLGLMWGSLSLPGVQKIFLPPGGGRPLSRGSGDSPPGQCVSTDNQPKGERK